MSSIELCDLIAESAKNIKPSEIGELLGMAKADDMISFAVGMPDPVVFPEKELSQVGARIFSSYGKDILQYGEIAGHIKLRKKLVDLMKINYNTVAKPDNIIMTTGSMQGLDLCSRLLLDKSDIVLVEAPTFVDAMATFQFAGAKVEGIPCDNEGIDLNYLKAVLDSKKIKFIYVIPDFQNPTGLCWSETRRRDFINLVKNYEVFVIEDNPYGEIKYNEKINVSLKSLDEKGQVIFLGSLSKTLSPGLRVGWVFADEKLIKVMKLVKERCDCHSSIPDQMLAAEYMEMYSYKEHIESIKILYKKRLEILVKALDKHLPQCKYSIPEGGFFLWLELPAKIDCMKLFEKGIKNKVCFVPGTPFYPLRNVNNFIRINFTFINEEKIEEGILRIKKSILELE